MKPAAAAAAATLLLGSCATLMPFALDRSATAPQLTGFGRSDLAVTTNSQRARELFNQGVLQAYAFNEVEAVRMFKAALAQDPACAMCAWGVAWQLGPNINDDSRGRVPEALNYVGHALKHAAGATPRERALIEAMAVRYAHASTARETAPLTEPTCGSKGAAAKPDPLDVAYAQKMRALADAYPNDPDILSLYAEAEMVATDTENVWGKDGKAVGRLGDVIDRVERLLPQHLQHTGLNHYMIHLADGLPAAQRAVAAADRLGELAPKSPHLLHMPAHIYVHVGRYLDAIGVNTAAEAAEAELADAQKNQGFTVSKDWRGHNRQFLWYAAVMAGQQNAALAAAERLAEQVGAGAGNFGEYVRSLRLITLVRLEQWDRVLAEPQPAGDKGIAQGWYEYARGVAQARTGKTADALASFTRLQVAAANVRSSFTTESRGHKFARAMADVAETSLQAQIALAQRNYDEAITLQRKAMAAAEKLDEREPPVLADGTRLVLGDIQLAAGRHADAEASFRTALAEHPQSGWALRGLARALQAQGKRSEADAVRVQLERAWRDVPPALLAAT